VFGRAGELFAGVDASFRSSFSSSPSYSRYLVAGGYGLLNARAGFRSADGWSITLWARNLTGSNYFEFLTAAPGNSGLYVGLPGDPRTFGLTLKRTFKKVDRDRDPKAPGSKSSGPRASGNDRRPTVQGF
jgi:iron complex outermembrane receptor protein